MSAHKRILLLGPTGVDKAAAMARLRIYALEKFGQKIRFIDFENEFLKLHIKRHSIRTWTSFLATDVLRQSIIWRDAWTEFQKTLDSETVVLGLHATYVSGILGLRSPIHIPAVCDVFKPTLVITLIDDVPTMWRRTEERAKGQEIAGRPTMEQLLSSRRAEQILGDMVVTHSSEKKTRHVVCAAANALTTLTNLIIFDADVTYLSFPISVPREILKETGDRPGISPSSRS